MEPARCLTRRIDPSVLVGNEVRTTWVASDASSFGCAGRDFGLSGADSALHAQPETYMAPGCPTWRWSSSAVSVDRLGERDARLPGRSLRALAVKRNEILIDILGDDNLFEIWACRPVPWRSGASRTN